MMEETERGNNDKKFRRILFIDKPKFKLEPKKNFRLMYLLINNVDNFYLCTEYQRFHDFLCLKL